MIELCEVFRSIQGESSFAGLPCVFVRLSGCNLRCRYCDTQYALRPGTPRAIPDIVADVQAYGPGLVEVTGGEPLLHVETPSLLEALAATGRTVLLETNGTLPLPDAPRPYHTIMDVKCPSSGEAEHFRKDNVALLQTGDELKFVVAGRRDFGWMLNCIDRLAIDTEKVRVLVAPVYQVCALRDLAEWVLAAQRSNLRLQPQLHRVIWPEVERGR